MMRPKTSERGSRVINYSEMKNMALIRASDHLVFAQRRNYAYDGNVFPNEER